MARLRRPEPAELAAVELDESPPTAAERVEPRGTLDAPSRVTQAGPEAVERWAIEHAPWTVLSDADALAARQTRERQAAYTRARMEARRAGLRMPDPADFFGDDAEVAAD
jgi:hypothetical protein